MPGDDDLHYPKRSAGPRPALEELAARWDAAADRAFSGVLGNPAAYHRITLLVAAVAAELRAAGPGIEPLVRAWDRRHDLVRGVGPADTQPGAGVPDVEVVAGAAFAMRYRQVRDELRRADRLSTISAAQADIGWLVLEESGVAAGDPFVPYRRLEVELGTGRAVLVSTQPDESFTGCVHLVEPGSVDLATGHLAIGTDSQQSRRVASQAEREALVASIKKGSPAADGFFL